MLASDDLGRQKGELRPSISPLLVIGIGGASSSGKTLLLKHTISNLYRGASVHIDLDGYHRYTRQERAFLGVYPEEISSNYIERAIQDIICIKQGRTVEVPTYDHTKGVFGTKKRVSPAPLIFVEGLHGACLNEWAIEQGVGSGNLPVDTSVFVFPEEDIRKAWKVHRDVLKRNYCYERAVAEISERQPFVQKEVLPQLYEADIVMRVEKRRGAGLLQYLLISTHFYNMFTNDTKGLIDNLFSLKQVNIENRELIRVTVKSVPDSIAFSLKNRLERYGVIVKSTFFSFPTRQTIGYIGRELLLLIVLKVLEVHKWEA